MIDTQSRTFTEAELIELRANVKAVMTEPPVRRCRQCGIGVEVAPPGMLWWCVQLHFNHRVELCETCAVAQIDRVMLANPHYDRGELVAEYHKEPAEPCLRFCETRSAHRKSNLRRPKVASEESK